MVRGTDIPPKVRARVKERADGMCEYVEGMETMDIPDVVRLVAEKEGDRCGSAGDFRGLACHHLVLRSSLGPHTKENLILLCGRHSALFHRLREV
uniref:Putative homing endonuclease n=1 Tax=viral metagenome TaxID=1070528 RepID=A0A6H1ZTR5_9ZZZZ